MYWKYIIPLKIRMSYLKRLLAVWTGKLAITLSKLFGGQGSATCGQIVRKIYPDILRDLAPQIKGDIILVTGTNGKTTTTNMIYSMLKESGLKVACNNVGANMINGIVTAFVSSSDLLGRMKADYAVIEVDEASLRRIAIYFTPDYLVINNIFRDQLDRYGEIDTTIELIKEAIEKWYKVKLILNADDPLVAQFGKKVDRKCVYYGVEKLDFDEEKEETKEGRFCAFCGQAYEYEYYHYSQLGKYKCNNCGFERPNPDFYADNVMLNDKLNFDVIGNNLKFNVSINYKGLYNVHNSMAAITTASLCKVSEENIIKALTNFKPQSGRMEKFIINGREVVLNLSKNPSGFNQAISTVKQDTKNKNIIITINDNAQDGRDISWLWDVDFEKFQEIDENINVYLISGTRKEDMALRLKYAGIREDKIKIADSLDNSFESAVNLKSDIVYALINYTALFDARKILKDRAGK